MRTYGQFCGIAKALDTIGDRWSLLIVRELLALGPSRHTDLRNGLPSIASNLLVDRLRELESAGVVRRDWAPPPIATTLYSLTERGRALEPVLQELGRWGMPLLEDDPATDTFRTHWLALPAQVALVDHAPDRPPVVLQLHADDSDDDLALEIRNGSVHVHHGQTDHPTATLTGPRHLLTATLTGSLDLAEAQQRGLRATGDRSVLRRVLPGRTSPDEAR